MGSEPDILINMYKLLIERENPNIRVTVKPNFGKTTFLFNALNRKLVLPKLGLSVTFTFGFSRSINNLYILMRMSGSLPILPAITTFCVAGENEICVKPSAPKTAASARASGNLRRDFCKRPMMPLTPTASLKY